MTPFKKAPEGVAGDSEILSRSLMAVSPHAGTHMGPDGADEITVPRRSLCLGLFPLFQSIHFVHASTVPTVHCKDRES